MIHDPLADRMARRLRVIAEPTRMLLLHELRGRELSVQELTEALETSQQNASKHLSLLHEAGFSQAQVETLDLDPPVVCVIARRR